MPFNETTSVTRDPVQCLSSIEEICIDVTKGLDPIRGMAKVMRVMGVEKEGGEGQMQVDEAKVVGVHVRNLVAIIRTSARAKQFGLSSVFEESVKWLVQVAKVAGEGKPEEEIEEKMSAPPPEEGKKKKSKSK